MRVHGRSFSRLVSVLVLTLTLTGALAAQSLDPIGSFGFLLNTSYSDPSNEGGMAILGIMNFDGEGNVSGPYTLELGSGGTQPVQTITGTFKGTYSSTHESTGSITIAFDNGLDLSLAMVIADRDTSLNLIVTSCSCDLTGTVISGVARYKMQKASESVATLRGSYGGQSGLSPQASREVFVWSFNGAGQITTSGTFVEPGGTAIIGSNTGTYTVNSDGTGTVTLAKTSNQGVNTFVFVTTECGSGLLLLQTNRLGNGVMFGTAGHQ